MAEPCSVSVVVPVYNGARTLPQLVARIIAVSDATPSLRVVEIVLVDDASHDDSWVVIARLAGEHPRVRGVGLPHNVGQHAALRVGILRSVGDVVVTMDDDLQHLPEEIPPLVAGLGSGVDLAYGRPVVDEHGIVRNLASRGVKWAVAAAAGSKVPQLGSGFRAMRGSLRTGLGEQAPPYASLDVALARLTTRMVAVPVAMRQRQHGRSNYTPGALMHHALSMLFGFSGGACRAASAVGLGGYVTRRYVHAPDAAPDVGRTRAVERSA